MISGARYYCVTGLMSQHLRTCCPGGPGVHQETNVDQSLSGSCGPRCWHLTHTHTFQFGVVANHFSYSHLVLEGQILNFRLML